MVEKRLRFCSNIFEAVCLILLIYISGIITFFCGCFAASSVYCFNDIIDVEADRKHPVKCHRAIASGEISIKQGYLLMLFMILLSIFTTFFLKKCMDCIGNHIVLLDYEYGILQN